MDVSELNQRFGEKLGSVREAVSKVKFEGRRTISEGKWTAFLADGVVYSARLKHDPNIDRLILCEVVREDDEEIEFAVAPHELDAGKLDIRDQFENLLSMAPWLAPQFNWKTREPEPPLDGMG